MHSRFALFLWVPTALAFSLWPWSDSNSEDQPSTQLISNCPFSKDLFESATQIYEQRLEFDRMLWEMYNIDPSDVSIWNEIEFELCIIFLQSQPAGGFLAENGEASSSVENIRNADILIDYQRLIREALIPEDGTCSAIDLSGFPETVEKYTECVPEEQRCPSQKVDCDSNEK